MPYNICDMHWCNTDYLLFSFCLLPVASQDPSECHHHHAKSLSHKTHQLFFFFSVVFTVHWQLLFFLLLLLLLGIDLWLQFSFCIHHSDMNSSLSFLSDWKGMCKQPSKYNLRDLMRDVWATYDEHLRFLCKAKFIWPTCHHMVELAGVHTSCSMYSLMWPFLGSKLDKHFYKLVCCFIQD